MKLTLRTEKAMIDRKIVEALRALKSHRAIGRELRVGVRRIGAVAQLAKAAGYLDENASLPPYPEALFSEAQRPLHAPSDPEKLLLPLAAKIKEQLDAGWHKVTVFEELPVKVGRSSFYRFLERHKLTPQREHDRVVPEIVHRPGEALLLDWGHLCTITCPDTGARRKVWALVGVLGYSRLMAVRLVWTNSVDVTLTAIEEILHELGGVPRRVTSDNPKCFALEASKYQPILHPAFELFAQHYNFTIECLPPADPEKKGKVERPMPFVRRLFEAHGEWKGIDAAQEYMARKITLANERIHGTTGQKPAARFEESEAAALKDLPPLRYLKDEFAEPVVRADGHVRFKGKYYSVGEKLRGKSVVVLGNAKTVRIYHDGKLLETHARVLDPMLSKSTKNHHLKSWEQTISDNAFYIKKARTIGPDVAALVERILGCENGFVDTRMVWGLFDLATRYEHKDVNDACALSMETHGYTYRDVRRILEKTSPLRKKEESKKYAFTRDMSEYASIIKEQETHHECQHPSGTTPRAASVDSRAGATRASE